MQTHHFQAQGEHHASVLDPASRDFYIRTIERLQASEIPFLLGGAYAFAQFTGIERHTKDLDIFVRAEDARRVLDVLEKAGYETSFTYSHWLGKAVLGDNFVDVIFSSGNGACCVDDGWFAHAERSEIFGLPILLMPPEEMIWQKALILERERYDGADVAHLIHCRAEQLDWARLLARFDSNWPVLLSHLILFGFIYPSERDRVPAAVMGELLQRLRDEMAQPPCKEKICRGTILSRAQYLTDVQVWGYADARVENGDMDCQQVAAWTEAIEPRD